MSDAGYSMLPWLRRGLSTLDSTLDGERLQVDVEVRVVADGIPVDPLQSKQVRLYGPGDVLGFNPGVVARLEPRANIGDFEPNYFPFIEFAQPDFPWRFSTKLPGIGGQKKVWPWLTLIVLERDALNYDVEAGESWESIAELLYGSDTVADALEAACGSADLDAGSRLAGLPRALADPAGMSWSIRLQQVTVGAEFTPPAAPASANGEGNLPRSISVSPALLPDLDEAWRWAHVQVAQLAGGNDLTGLAAMMRDEPQRLAARLVCARRLLPGRRYQAFVVPTFKLGVLAGLGQPFNGEVGDALAWADGDTDPIDLPYYFTWEFGTGLRGDFEYLVRLLEPRKLTGLGLREVDCDKPGYGQAGVERTLADGDTSPTLEVEGALQSLDTEPTKWGKDLPDSPVPALQAGLSALLNRPGANIATAAADTAPEVVPPIYGRWQAARQSVDVASPAWTDVLNLDPRHRMAAGLGAIVVEREQEPLMASAWQQLGAVEEANKLLRQAQLGREGSLETFRRLEALPTGPLLRIAQPVASRVLAPAVDGSPQATVRERLRGSPVPLAAVAPAFRRVARRRGPLRRRQQSVPKGKFRDLLERLNSREIAAAGPAPKPDGMPGLCDITIKMLACDGMFKWAKSCCGTGASRRETAELAKKYRLFCEENIDCRHLKVLLTKQFEAARKPEQQELIRQRGLILAAFCGVLEQTGRLPGDPKPRDPVDLEGLRRALLDAVDPRKSIVERVWKRIRLSGNIRRGADPLDRIMAAPEFPQPMYEPLAEISQDHVLPGLASVPQNTIGLVKTNGRYIESYMTGCSHAFAGELLWREYPTDQRGTYFRQFWDVSVCIPNPAEREAIRTAVDAEHPDMPDEEVELEVDKRLTELRKDIKPIHLWSNPLGGNDVRPPPAPGEENLVLLLRGDLLKKYPNTVIYAVPARFVMWDGKRRRVPELPEYKDLLTELSEDLPEGQRHADPSEERVDPIFSATLLPDVTALGFPLTEGQVKSTTDYAGYYFVLEERVAESRFGMDEAGDEPIDQLVVPDVGDEDPDDVPDPWEDLTWDHLALQPGEYVNGQAPDADTDLEGEWNRSSAKLAEITLQKPVRIAVHADLMVPDHD